MELLTISGLVLDEKFKRNASKFEIFHIYENPKLLFPFFISCYIIMNARALIKGKNKVA